MRLYHPTGFEIDIEIIGGGGENYSARGTVSGGNGTLRYEIIGGKNNCKRYDMPNLESPTEKEVLVKVKDWAGQEGFLLERPNHWHKQPTNPTRVRPDGWIR